MLIARQLTYAVLDGDRQRNIFSNLDITFPIGAITSVTGPSGAGKTTLLSILSLLVRPTSGHIYYDKTNLTSLTSEKRQLFREISIGIVFQTARVLARLTLEEQVRFTAASMAAHSCTTAAWQRAERLGVAGLAKKVPSEMSGGEKQRVALVLALMKSPLIVLADEPTAALDDRSSQYMIDELSDYCASTMATVVAVTHDEKLKQASEKNIALNDYLASRASEN